MELVDHYLDVSAIIRIQAQEIDILNSLAVDPDDKELVDSVLNAKPPRATIAQLKALLAMVGDADPEITAALTGAMNSAQARQNQLNPNPGA